VAHDEVGIRINTKTAGWIDEDCRKSIKAKNEASELETQGLIWKNI
jgi:hypothetical protein